MSLTVLADVIQGTDDWHEQRRGIVTASEVGTIITPSTIKPASNMKARSYAAQVAAERITGWTDPTYVSDDMLRGTLDEPHAVDAYRDLHPRSQVETVGFMVRDDWGFSIGYSPDALVGRDGLLEVKSRRPKAYVQTVYEGKVPNEHVAQVQCALLVSGRKWLDYITYCGGLPLYVIRVEPDPAWQEALVEAVKAFEAAVAEMTLTYHLSVGRLPKTKRIIEQEMVI